MPSVSSPNISEAPLPPTIRALGWSSFLTDMASEAIYPLLPAFFMRELGLTSVGVGLLDGLASATAAIVRLPAGMLSDRMGRRPLVIVGYTLATLSRPFMGIVTGPFGASIVRVADRFGKGVRSAPRDALVADLVPSDMRGRAFGHIRAMDHAGAAAGPLVAMLFLWWFPGRERALFMLTILPGLAALAVVVRFVHDPYPVRRVLRADIPAQPLWPSLTGPQKTLLGCVALYSLGASSEQFLLMRAYRSFTIGRNDYCCRSTDLACSESHEEFVSSIYRTLERPYAPTNRSRVWLAHLCSRLRRTVSVDRSLDEPWVDHACWDFVRHL